MNIFDKIPVREKIKLLRVSNGITQEELAEKLNVSRSVIAKRETDNGTPEKAAFEGRKYFCLKPIISFLDSVLCLKGGIAFDKKGFRKPNTSTTTPKTKIGLPQLR